MSVSIWKLRLSMAGTLTIIVSLSTLFFALILTLANIFDFITLGMLVVVFNFVQWLISPYLINGLYHARELAVDENPKLHETVADLSRKSGIKKPKLMIAQVPIPNAFAYGSPIAGNRVAVTTGLLNTLDSEQIEAVVGHELGHLKHKDVQTMMFVSMLPALLYYIGYSLMLSMYGRRRDEGSNMAFLGIAFMAFSWILNIFILYLSRIREYYADRHSATIVDDGSRKLATGLAKLAQATKAISRTRKKSKSQNAFKALFITDPDRAEIDSLAVSKVSSASNEKLVEEIVSRKLTTAERVLEIFSTHPNIIKRLKALQELG